MPRLTLASAVTLEGVGLFSARPARVTIAPASGDASAGTGITFTRTDRPGSPPISTHVRNVVPASRDPALPPNVPARNTSLFAGDTFVHTVEHLLSALAAAGVTDAAVDLDAPEVPILDGSSRAFFDAIARAGTRPIAGEVSPLTLARAIDVRDDRSGSTITATPAAQPSFSYTLDFAPGCAIPPQRVEFDPARHDYARDIAPARTFSPEHEARSMQSAGFFRHLSPRDMLVLRADGTPIDNPLRFPDEPARHKLLDLIGDLALLARPLLARVDAVRSGHALTHELCRRILAAISDQ